MKSKIGFCAEDYNMLSEDQYNYTYAWKIYNSSYKPEYSFERVYRAFQYRTASELNGYPVIGTYNTYWGGGYVYEMRGQKSYLQGNLTLLQMNSWIDRQTRAVIVEFSIFNPNTNLIIAAQIVVEFLPTGAILTSARFDPINIFIKLSLFQVICHIAYMVFIIFFTIQEIRQLFKKGKNHIIQFWTLVEWLIICFSWTAFALFFYRINAADAVGKFFDKTSGYGYFKLQITAFWDLGLNYSLSFCIALGTLKFLKIFRFNKRISFLASTLSNCFKELISFGLMFGIIYFAFVQLFYFFYHKILYQFSTIMRSMVNCFEIMLGKFQVQPLLQADSFFGPIIYCTYNVCIIFVLLTMFVSIINDSFKIVREDSKKQDYEMFEYMRDRVKSFFEKKKENTIVYKDQIEYLTDKIDDLLLLVNDVNNFLFF
jgi:hypothetical protein